MLILSVSFGAPYISVTALDAIAADLGTGRSAPALAGALAWLGSAIGGLAMGRAADRFGVRATVIFGSVMIGLGLVISARGSALDLQLGHGLFMGLLGNAGINAPFYVYISRLFDRRRGTALALISSGPYIAGALWPLLFGQTITSYGWRETMTGFAALQLVLIVPLALLFLAPPPRPAVLGGGAGSGPAGFRLRKLSPNVTLALLCVAGVLCCVPMAMPQGHLIAFCGDLGISRTRGATMLSVLLGCAFVSRQFWGWLSDRIGGLETIVICSALQAAATLAFVLVQGEAGLFLVSALFGLGFSGIIPAYVLAVRELFPAAEAGWRIPTLLVFTGGGMALGGWLAGAMYDHYGYYLPAFVAGAALNLGNIAVIGFLVERQRGAGA